MARIFDQESKRPTRTHSEDEDGDILDIQRKQMSELKLAGLFCRVRMDLSLNKEYIEPKKEAPVVEPQPLKKPVPTSLTPGLAPQTQI